MAQLSYIDSTGIQSVIASNMHMLTKKMQRAMAPIHLFWHPPKSIWALWQQRDSRQELVPTTCYGPKTPKSPLATSLTGRQPSDLRFQESGVATPLLCYPGDFARR